MNTKGLIQNSIKFMNGVVNLAREGGTADTETLKTLSRMLNAVSLKNFQILINTLSSNAELFYKTVTQEKSIHDSNLYFSDCKTFIEKEEQLVSFLPAKEANLHLSRVFNILIYSREPEFLDGAEPVIANSLKSDDPRILTWVANQYRVFGGASGLDPLPMFNTCSTYIKNQVESIFKRLRDSLVPRDATADADLVTRVQNMPAKEVAMKVDIEILTTVLSEVMRLILKLKDNYNRAFKDFKDARLPLERAVKDAWNSEEASTPFLLSRYIDFFLRKRLQGYEPIYGLDFINLVKEFVRLLTNYVDFACQ